MTPWQLRIYGSNKSLPQLLYMLKVLFAISGCYFYGLPYNHDSWSHQSRPGLPAQAASWAPGACISRNSLLKEASDILNFTIGTLLEGKPSSSLERRGLAPTSPHNQVANIEPFFFKVLDALGRKGKEKRQGHIKSEGWASTFQASLKGKQYPCRAHQQSSRSDAKAFNK